MKCLSLAVSLTMMCACSTGPTSPDTPDRVASLPFTLSGTVSEMTSDGPAPVEGALITVALGAGRMLSATTDANGFFSISGTPAGASATVSVSKLFYTGDGRNVTLNADTRFDIEIVRHPTYTLSGVVTEATSSGPVPVERVEVYCDSCGPVGHTYAFTDANGFYSFADVIQGVHRFLVWKEGFSVIDPAGTDEDGRAKMDASVNGDTRFDMQVARR